MSNVIVEGGGTLLGSFLDAGLVDEVHIYIAPRLLGGQAAPGPWNGRGVGRVADSLRIARPDIMKLGDGWLLRGRTHE